MILVLRQVLYLSSPAVVLIECHFRAVAQCDSEAVRSDAVLIICIAPDFPDGCLGSLRSMGVGQGRYGTFHRRISKRIAFRQIAFVPCIFDFLAVNIHRKSCDLTAPVVIFCQCDRLWVALFICSSLIAGHQGNSKAVRSDSIAVLIIVPDFYYGNIDQLGVRYSISVSPCRDISVYCVLSDAVDNHCAFTVGVIFFLCAEGPGVVISLGCLDLAFSRLTVNYYLNSIHDSGCFLTGLGKDIDGNICRSV